jgi:16S rRNA (uracil1498-N3)-methyltransferase
MQLFITDFEKKWESIKISDIEILSQVRKVLRMKIWDTFFVQNESTRYKLEISDRDDKNIFWKILESVENSKQIDEIWIAIAMSNKRDKMETIVQKLSEIWIKNIFFRPSERSIIRERNEKKLDRLNKIAKEAIEQSRWRQLPKITFEKDISKIIEWKEIVVFDKSEHDFKNIWTIKNALWIIWPEWGLTENDYKKFWEKIKTVSLGDTVLRTETASIIAARYLKNF